MLKSSNRGINISPTFLSISWRNELGLSTIKHFRKKLSFTFSSLIKQAKLNASDSSLEALCIAIADGDFKDSITSFLSFSLPPKIIDGFSFTFEPVVHSSQKSSGRTTPSGGKSPRCFISNQIETEGSFSSHIVMSLAS
ncbi:hypothetical protein ES705_45478 [subsurface metagenome]